MAALLTLGLIATGVSADSFDRLDTTGSAGELREAAGAFVPVFDEQGTRTNDTVFLLHGGYPPELDAQPASDVWVLADGYWRHLTSRAPAMAGHALIVGVDGRAWAVGAVGADGWTAPMTELVTLKVERVHGYLNVVIEPVRIPGPAPEACFGAAAVGADGGRSILTVGGNCLGNPLEPDPGELWEYRLDRNRWTRHADLPVSISDHSAIVARDFIWVFGGSTAAGPTNELYRYDLLAGGWSSVDAAGPRPDPRRSHRAVAAGRNMLVFGGLDEGLPPNINTLADVWQLDLDRVVWTGKSAMHSGLAGMAAAVIPPQPGGSRYVEVLIYGGLVDAWSFPYELSDATSIYTSDIASRRELARGPSQPFTSD
jgi:hypothetical protein